MEVITIDHIQLGITILVAIIIPLIVQLVVLGIIIGIYKTTITFMQQQIAELKTEMKKYNNILERIIRVEDSTKSAHHRIDEMKGISE